MINFNIQRYFNGGWFVDEKDILRKLIKDDALFNQIHIIKQRYDIIPDDKDHIGSYIEYQDIEELRDDFLEELVDSVVDWIYSAPKYEQLKKKAMEKGKSESAACHEIGRRAKDKFRANHNDEKLLIQGQLGELLLFHFIQHCMKAIPLLRKMSIATSSDHERFGADAIHYKIEDGKHIIILGEAKTYTSKYKFNEAFEDALESILNTYSQRKKELKLYVHEDFLDDDMNKIAEDYLNNNLDPVEIHLVSIITYNETAEIRKTSQTEIQKQIEKIIEEKYKNFDNTKIDINSNPILKRITYIVFPIWNLRELAERFQNML